MLCHFTKATQIVGIKSIKFYNVHILHKVRANITTSIFPNESY